jgi:tetratricopeptide (TPR) repeat protein
VQLLRRAWQQHPEDFWANEELGLLLNETEPQRWAESVRHVTAGVALRPDSAGAYLNLGNALHNGGQLDDAIACYRRALKLDGNYAGVYDGLGAVLARQGRLEESIASFRKAIEVDPKFAAAYTNLGSALGRKGQVDEAIACFRKAIELNPTDADVHCNLGIALRNRGDFRAALAALRMGHELGSRRPGWPHPSGKWVRQCERFVQLDDLLAATRKGKARPAGPAECVELANFCRQQKLGGA